MTRLKPSSVVTEPVRITGSALRRMPGAEKVSKAAEGTLDAVGSVSPRGRRLAVYTGAGVLGVAGVVEWPVAIAGAAVAWLTQPKPGQREQQTAGHGSRRGRAPSAGATASATPGSAARTAGHGGRTASRATRAETGEPANGTRTSTGLPKAGQHRAGQSRMGQPKAVHGTGTTTIRAATAHRRTADRRRGMDLSSGMSTETSRGAGPDLGTGMSMS
ncbi:hypothetical protein ACWC10_04040 [Streptomyces sp. NPDC001595]|uniref:hypothetical protein n=1 Tax=Streptomyces sp. NPDC001532 TaxID=3154520 RepID=UPI00331B2C83